MGVIIGTTRWLEVLGIAVWTLAETGSALAVALMLFARTLPMVLLGVPVGGLADRVDRRRLYAVGLGTCLVASVVLLAAAVAGALAPWRVAVGAFVTGTVWALEHPVRRAMIADAVGLSRIGTALSFDAATLNGTRMTGPLAGGVLYAALGLHGIYAFAVVAYAGVAVAVLTMPSMPGSRRGSREPFLRSLPRGIAAVRAVPVVAGVLGVTVIANLFGFCYASVAPVIGDRVLGLDALGLGVLLSMEGLGAFLGALVLAFSVRPADYRRVFIGGTLLFMTMLLVFSLSSNVALSMAALFLAGVGAAGFGAMQSTILVFESEPEIRSRVMGILVVCIGTSPLGILLLGGLSETIGAPRALAATAACGILCVALATTRWPELVRARG